MDTTNIERYLNSFGKQVVSNAKKNLNSAGKGGGNLEKSIRFEVVTDADGFSVKFFMADYGTFVDKGVKGAGGKIKSGDHKGSWGGRRHYITWKGKRKDSPYKFGTGTGKKGGMRKGIGSFIKKKGLQPRSEGGQYMTTAGLRIAIMRVLWIKGIHGISFFQKSLMLGMKEFGSELLGNVKQDIIDTINETQTTVN
tara:strand:- start:961 stop:1548 length:588 start_codon:yes stop_codon:yes gene_type:complete